MICKIIWLIMIDWLIDRMRKMLWFVISLGCYVIVWVCYCVGIDLIFFYCILMVMNLIWVFYGIDYFYLNDWFEFYFFVRIFCLFGDNCVCLEIEFSIVYKLKRVYNEKKYEIFN